MGEARKFDIAVVGGGLHGVSMASEAASRGLSVLLLQGNDLASGPTGSLRSILRGGIRKIENLQFSEVNSSLKEIARLKAKAPHLLKLVNFHVFGNSAVRSDSRVKTGLYLYNKLQGRHFDKVALQKNQNEHGDSWHYCDYQLKTARLILSLARQAESYGANILPQHKIEEAKRDEQQWQLQVLRKQDGAKLSFKAGALINCCGWLANQFLENVLNVNSRCRAEVVHYAHAIIKKPFPFDKGFLFQQENTHLLYAHSLDEERFVLGPLVASGNDQQDNERALNAALDCWNQYQNEKISREHVQHCLWTARAKIEDPSCNDKSVYRDSLLDLNNPGHGAPLLNVFGVNMPQHRVLAEQGLEILKPFTQANKNPEFIHQPLPGGELGKQPEKYLAEKIKSSPPPLQAWVERLLDNYGSLFEGILQNRKTEADLGRHFGHGLYEAEVNYLLENEWACSAEDILWRRTSYGLYFTHEQTSELESWIKSTG